MLRHSRLLSRRSSGTTPIASEATLIMLFFLFLCGHWIINYGLDIFLGRSAAADEKSLTLGLLLKVAEEMSWKLDLSSEAIPARHMMSPLPNTVSLPGAL